MRSQGALEMPLYFPMKSIYKLTLNNLTFE